MSEIEAAQNKINEQLRSLFVRQRIDIVPKVTYCIVAELCFMFFYIVITTICWHEWSSTRELGFAWLLLAFYFFFWLKNVVDFVEIFGTIVKDTALNDGVHPVEMSYPHAVLAVSMVVGAAVNWYLNSETVFFLYSGLYCAGSVVSFCHFRLLKAFMTEPDESDLKVAMERAKREKAEMDRENAELLGVNK
jgi:hypothetical protein